jgi:lipid-binding SYLF domain-containing protein
VFAGVSLEGSTIRSDDEANQKLYGKVVNAKQIIVQREVKTPPAGQSLNQLLNSTSARPA